LCAKPLIDAIVEKKHPLNTVTASQQRVSKRQRVGGCFAGVGCTVDCKSVFHISRIPNASPVVMETVG
jgi:hypothetical protein